jgi:hypothetical protein
MHSVQNKLSKHWSSLIELVKMRISSRYTETTPSVMRSWKISFIIVWKVAGLLVRPKYMTRGLKRPQFVQMAAFHSLPSQIWTLLYPQCTLSFVKYHAPLSQWIRLSIKGRGYWFFQVMALSAQ